MDFRVAGALELFEDHFVHARAGVDERGGDDGERAALLDVARRAEEALRTLQRVAVHAAREHLARGRDDGVVGARQTGDRVEQDDDVLLVLDQALGLLDHHLGDLHVALGRLVEGRRDDLAAHRALHVGDFFRPLVDEQHDQIHLGVVLGDAVGDALQQHRLAGARRRDDQAALALAERRQQVHHPARQVLGLGLEIDLLLRVERREVLEEDLLLRLLGRLEVDRLDLDQREVALAVLRRPDDAGDGVAGVQVELADLRGRDVDVVGAGQVVVVGGAQEAEAVGERLEHAFREDVAALLGAHAEDLEDQLLLAHARGAGDVQLLGDLGQRGDAHLLHRRQRDGLSRRGRRGGCRRRCGAGAAAAGAGGAAAGASFLSAFSGGAVATPPFGLAGLRSSSTVHPVLRQCALRPAPRAYQTTFRIHEHDARVPRVSACRFSWPRPPAHRAATESIPRLPCPRPDPGCRASTSSSTARSPGRPKYASVSCLELRRRGVASTGIPIARQVHEVARA